MFSLLMKLTVLESEKLELHFMKNSNISYISKTTNFIFAFIVMSN